MRQAHYFPSNAYLELTYRCNYHCRHCYCVVPETAEERARELSTPEWCQLLDQMSELGVLSIALTGGEALLRADFFDILAYARAKRFSVRIYTNAQLLTPRKSARLAELRPTAVEASLYGATQETYERFVGPAGRLSRVVENLRSLQAAGITVAVKIVAARSLVPELDEMKRLLRENGLRCIPGHDTHIIPKPDCSRVPLEEALTGADLAALIEAQKWYRVAKDWGPDDKICNAAMNHFAVSPYGDVLPCLTYKVPGGNIRHDSLKSIWEGSPLFLRVRALTFKDYKICGGCSDRVACTPCAALNHLERGDPTVPFQGVCDHSRVWRKYIRIRGPMSKPQAA